MLLSSTFQYIFKHRIDIFEIFGYLYRVAMCFQTYNVHRFQTKERKCCSYVNGKPTNYQSSSIDGVLLWHFLSSFWFISERKSCTRRLFLFKFYQFKTWHFQNWWKRLSIAGPVRKQYKMNFVKMEQMVKVWALEILIDTAHCSHL